MTHREQKIINALLEVAHNLDGGQMTETLLHCEVNLQVTPTAALAEFNDALAICDQRGWLIGVPSRFSGRKWNITDAGEAARLEIRQSQR
jgi:hypothetical protein